MEHVMNKSFDEIQTAYNEMINKEDDIREMIRLHLSSLLIDTNEDNKFECDVALDTRDCCGLSSLEMPWVTAIWQHPTEGWITFVIDERSERDFDEMSTEELMQVVSALK